MDRKLVFNIMPLKLIFLILKILNLNTHKLNKNSTKNKYEMLLLFMKNIYIIQNSYYIFFISKIIILYLIN